MYGKGEKVFYTKNKEILFYLFIPIDMLTWNGNSDPFLETKFNFLTNV